MIKISGHGGPFAKASCCLLDTKYKAASSPSSGDVQQVIAYAKALGCSEAVLVYPIPLEHSFEDNIGGDIHVWTTDFNVSGDLEANGQAFLKRVLDVVRGSGHFTQL